MKLILITFQQLLVIFCLLTAMFSYGQNLDDYINMLKQNSINLKARLYDEKINIEKINEADTYPDTQISFGIYALQPETRVGNQTYKIGISQVLPWFGTQNTEKKYLQNKAQLSLFDTQLQTKQLILQLKTLYFQLYALQTEAEILKENKQVLKTYESMALAALSNNKSSMTDVLNIRIKKNELHVRIFQSLNKIDAIKEQFNRMLNRDLQLPINIPEKLDVTDILPNKSTVTRHPLLQKNIHNMNVISDQMKWLKKQSYPKILLGLDYISVSPQAAQIEHNGKDILLPRLGLSIPLFNHRYKSQIEQLKIKKQQIHFQNQQMENDLKDALIIAKTELENQIVQIMAADKNIAQSQRSIDITLKSYETGMLDFDKIIQLQLQKIKYQLIKIHAVQKAFEQQARIDFLTD